MRAKSRLWILVLLACLGASLPLMADQDGPALLFIQGELEPDGGPIYEKYLAGTRPLMAEYGVRVMAVGGGLPSEHTTDSWQVNAVLEFPDRAAAEAFLADPRYQKIKRDYRDAAYATLHLTLVAGRTPRVETPEQLAEAAFADFRHGLASGEWDGFLARLTDDFTLRFPVGQWRGTHQGREKAAEFFAYVSAAFPDGIEIVGEPLVTVQGKRAVIEFEDRGTLFGKPYHNFVTISLDMRDGKISGYREYFGDIAPPPES